MTNKLINCFTTLSDSNTPLALATVVQAVSPTSARAGNKALISTQGIVEGWIGGGCAQPSVIAAAAETLTDGQARLIRVAPKGEWATFEGVADFNSGCLSGGTLVIFIEPLQQQAVLAILGSSPVAQYLSRLAAEVDFNVTLACPDARPEHFADGLAIQTDFNQINANAIVIATQGRHDRAALKAAIESKAQYIGMIASEKKAAGLKVNLAKLGMSESNLERLSSPAGIEIGAETPAEIALSVLAQLVEWRRSGDWQALAKTIQPGKVAETAPTEPSKTGGCCGG